MSFTVVIPARYASSRLPGKPLLDIAGQTMIYRVYHAAKKSAAHKVIVATDDSRIFDHVKTFTDDVIMTSSNHQSGTDRLYEVAKKIDAKDNAILVNVQGDEPLMPAAAINQVARNLEANIIASVATLKEKITDMDQCFDPNIVKVVSNSQKIALYFSRAPIPWSREFFDAQSGIAILPAKKKMLSEVDHYYRHIGLYAYRVSLLKQFVKWPESSLEKIEKLEQLRIMENGHYIHVDESCESIPGGVDTAEDLALLNKRSKNNKRFFSDE